MSTLLIEAVILWEGETKFESQTFGVIPDEWEGSLENHPLDDRVFYWLESNEAQNFTKGYTDGNGWIVRAIERSYFV
jgi:hypothetical protein